MSGLHHPLHAAEEVVDEGLEDLEPDLGVFLVEAVYLSSLGRGTSQRCL